MKQFPNIILLIVFAMTGTNLVLPKMSHAHCQIPCGIYDDHARIQAMIEDATTIEKSAKLIAELSGKSDVQSQGQLVRWVVNKEKHAQKIISTICDYFLTQRVKPNQDDYADRLMKHHAVINKAMKVKQNTDVKYAKKVKESIMVLSAYYPEKKH